MRSALGAGATVVLQEVARCRASQSWRDSSILPGRLS
jgi:hypothetical protein